MPELGVHASLLHSEHMFEPMVTFRKFVKPLRMQDKSIHLYIKGVSQLVDITAGGDFLSLCDQKSSYNMCLILDGYGTSWRVMYSAW